MKRNGTLTLTLNLQMDMNTVVEEINDKHMGPWADACNKDGVENSPLSPYIDQELLHNQHLYLYPGKLSQSTDFIYNYPKMTKETLKEVRIHVNTYTFYSVITILSKLMNLFFAGIRRLRCHENFSAFPSFIMRSHPMSIFFRLLVSSKSAKMRSATPRA